MPNVCRDKAASHLWEATVRVQICAAFLLPKALTAVVHVGKIEKFFMALRFWKQILTRRYCSKWESRAFSHCSSGLLG
jgi:hypothetical protein